jgi:predicted metal-binding protein
MNDLGKTTQFGESMFEEMVEKLKSGVEARRVLPRENDVDILEELYRKGKQKQYELEKNLTKSGRRIAHSTVTGKLKRICSIGMIETSEEDGFTRFGITPLGLSMLLYKSRINFNQILTYIETNPQKTLDALLLFQPHLVERMKNQPPWFPVQLTSDLWAIYLVREREDLRRKTLKYITGSQEELKKTGLNYRLQPVCTNRMEVEGKDICLKQRSPCVYEPLQISKCPILGKQMHEELEKLEKTWAQRAATD